jgi:uncharacterized protein (TIGR01777 family)
VAGVKPATLTVLVAGASGFIGTELVKQLAAAGHTVTTLVRRAPRSSTEYRWSPADGTIDSAAIDSADAVVNLAGATTGRIPWTPGYKREILYSRVSGARTIAEAIAAASAPPAVFLSGSAVGYYGDRPGETLTEASTKGTGFLSDVVEAWENAALLTPPSTRTVLMRTGVVVGRGGAFTPLLPLTTLGLGARFGPGTQNWPWIALYDEAASIRHLLTSTLDGVVNLTGPIPATSREITHSLAQTIGRWDPWVVPTFALKLLGDAGKDQLLSSQLVTPERLIADGFAFRYETVEKAIGASFGS